MQAAEPTLSPQPTSADAACLGQLSALKAKIRDSKHRSVHLWHNCKPDAEENMAARKAIGAYTEKFLRKQVDAFCA